MNLWQRFESGRKASSRSQGVSLHFEKGIEPEFRTLCIRFARWMRKKYSFPVHLHIYIKDCERIRLLNGRYAYGGFRYYVNRPPYIRIPARIESHLKNEYDTLEIYYMILGSLVHELTHYFQWVAELEQTDAASERQANYYRYRILEQFCRDSHLPF